MSVQAIRFMKPLPVLATGAALLVAFIVGANLFVLGNLRGATLKNAELALTRHSLTLAEQGDRAFRSLDLVLSSIDDYIDRVAREGELSANTAMVSREMHLVLKEKLTGLPHVEAITVVSADGRLLNLSQYFPAPLTSVADREFYAGLRDGGSLTTIFSVPVADRGAGTRSIYIARRIHGPKGEVRGYLLAAMALTYFEELYRSTSPGVGSSVSLVRADGMLLARHPSVPSVGDILPNAGIVAGQRSQVVKLRSPIDGEMRITSSHALAGYPLLVLSTQTEGSALQSWWEIVHIVGLVSMVAVLAVLGAAIMAGRWWRQQDALVRAATEQADAEKARALAEAELLRVRERAAESASRAKSSFLAVMSHEIRTPMNAVLGLASTLLSSDLKPEDREAVKAIHDSGDSLLEILNDILDYSKLEAGELSFEKIAFAPAAVTETPLAIIGPRAMAKGLVLRAEVDPDLPPALMGDAGRLRQVLLNIVSNAVKFTEKGSVTAAVRSIARTGNRATVEWEVRDTGIGIPQERLGLLFRDFVQADCTINRRFGGSGLGLAICKRIIEQMDGQISVRSEMGQGTTVCFSVTLEVTDAPVTVDTSGHDEVEALDRMIARLGRPLRVLVADDNATNRLVAGRMLRDLDAQVDMACDGAEAVTAAMRFAYDVVLMDMRMPEMDGLEATRTIRARPGHNTATPIIALTANAFPDDVTACLAAGMNEFVAKPVRKRDLLAAIVRILQPALAAKAVAPEARPARYKAAALLNANVLATLRREIGEDALQEALDTFLDEVRDRIARMPALVSETPADALQREAHSVKGMAGTFGFMRLQAIAARLEKDAGRTSPDDLLQAIGDLRVAFEETVCLLPATRACAA